MKQDTKDIRSKAIEWWDNQDEEYKGHQFRQYQRENFTSATDYGLVTDIEIEKIYLDLKLSEKALPEHPQQSKEPETIKEADPNKLAELEVRSNLLNEYGEQQRSSEKEDIDTNFESLKAENTLLSALNKELRGALNPFDKLADECLNNSNLHKDQDVYGYNKAKITMQDLRNVKAALQNNK